MESTETYSAPPDPKNPFQIVDLTLFKEETKESFLSIFSSVK